MRDAGCTSNISRTLYLESRIVHLVSRIAYLSRIPYLVSHISYPVSRISTHVSRIFPIFFVVLCTVLCPRGAARLSRDQGDGARPVQRAVAYASLGRHALADCAENTRRREESERARRTGAGGFTRRTALDRRRAKWAGGEAHRVRRTSIDNHRRARPPRDAGRQEMDNHRPPFAAVGRDCRLANVGGK